MDLNVQVSDELVIGLDVPPAIAERLGNIDFNFRVSGEEELRELTQALGGVEKFTLSATSSLVSRYSVPVTRDGEVVRTAQFYIFLDDEMRQPEPIYEPVQRLIEEREQQRREAEKAEVPGAGS